MKPVHVIVHTHSAVGGPPAVEWHKSLRRARRVHHWALSCCKGDTRLHLSVEPPPRVRDAAQLRDWLLARYAYPDALPVAERAMQR